METNPYAAHVSRHHKEYMWRRNIGIFWILHLYRLVKIPELHEYWSNDHYSPVARRIIVTDLRRYHSIFILWTTPSFLLVEHLATIVYSMWSQWSQWHTRTASEASCTQGQILQSLQTCPSLYPSPRPPLASSSPSLWWHQISCIHAVTITSTLLCIIWLGSLGWTDPQEKLACHSGSSKSDTPKPFP